MFEKAINPCCMLAEIQPHQRFCQHAGARKCAGIFMHAIH